MKDKRPHHRPERPDDEIGYVEALGLISERIDATYARKKELEYLSDRVEALESGESKPPDQDDGGGNTGDNGPSAPSEGYTLTPATKTKLGGVKVGDNLDVTEDGTLSVSSTVIDRLESVEAAIEGSSDSEGDYILPVASSEKLGGVKIGENVSVTSDGTISVDLTGVATKDEVNSIENRVGILESSNGEENVIEEVKVNGVKQEPVEKAIDIKVPTKTDELINNSDFQTSADVLRIVSEKVGEGGEINGILGVTRNGINVPDQEGIVNIEVPEKTSDLMNDLDFQTKTEVDSTVERKLNDFDVVKQIKINGEIQNELNGVVDLIISIPKSVGELSNDLNFQTETQVDDKINAKISSVYKPGGSLDYPDKSKLSEENVGRVYDIRNEFTTDSDFANTISGVYPAGTNIVVLEQDGQYKFGTLSGFIDTSSFAKTTEVSDLRLIVNDAKSTATEAKSTAEDASLMANSANSKAISASNDASTAKTLAQEASDIAVILTSTANDAKAKADSAESTANTIKDEFDAVKENLVTVDKGATIAFDSIVKSLIGDGPYTFTVKDTSSEKSLEIIIDEKFADVNRYLASVINVGAVPYGKELTDSWVNLRSKIVSGDMSGINIGDYKTVTLTTSETVIMEVAGIDQYYNCGDTPIGHHVDFISRNCLKKDAIFNASGKNNGNEVESSPWRASELFRIMNDEITGIYSTLSDDLKSCIIDKRAFLESRYSSVGDLNDSSGWVWNFMGKLWIPTEREIWGSVVWSDQSWTGGAGCNIQYPIFIGGIKHIIKGDGNDSSRVGWWEASTRRDSSTNICVVSSYGYANHVIASRTGIRIPLCFRIG